MKDNDVEELKKEMRRIERERQDHTNFIVGGVIVVIIVVLGIILYMHNPQSTAGMQDTAPTCDETGAC